MRILDTPAWQLHCLGDRNRIEKSNIGQACELDCDQSLPGPDRISLSPRPTNLVLLGALLVAAVVTARLTLPNAMFLVLLPQVSPLPLPTPSRMNHHRLQEQPCTSAVMDLGNFLPEAYLK